MWLRRKAIEGLFSVKAFKLELLQPWDEKAFVTFEWLCFIICLFYFCFSWVSVPEFGLSPVAVSGGHSSLQCMGFSVWWLLVAEHRLQAHGLQ